MKAVKDVLLTEEGRQRLRQELAFLQEKLDGKVREYAHAMDPDEPTSDSLHSEILFLGQRIAQLQDILTWATPVDSEAAEPQAVRVGSRVAVRWEDGGEDTYTIVFPPQVNLRAGRISYESPVGKALLGRSLGDRPEVATPSGSRRIVILAVEQEPVADMATA